MTLHSIRISYILRIIMLTFSIGLYANEHILFAETVSYNELKKVQEKLEDEKKQLSTLDEKTQHIEKELSGFRQRMIMLNEKIQRNEQDLLSLKTERKKLEEEKEMLLSHSEKTEGDQQNLLISLEKIALHPPVLQLLNPQDNKQKVETAIILNSLFPQLEEKSQILKEKIKELNHIENQVALQHNLENKTKEMIRKQYAELSHMLEQRAALYEKHNTESQAHKQKIQELSSKANSLQDLISSLEAQQKQHLPRPKQLGIPTQKLAPSSETKNTTPQQTAYLAKLSLPAQGKIVQSFGEKIDAGLPLQGIKLEARPGAPIISPGDGEILFIGPFRNYGNLLIIKHANERHSLITGFHKLNSAVGQKVLTGEPLGTISNDKETKHIVYYELRDHGTPVNPVKGLEKISKRN